MLRVLMGVAGFAMIGLGVAGESAMLGVYNTVSDAFSVVRASGLGGDDEGTGGAGGGSTETVVAQTAQTQAAGSVSASSHALSDGQQIIVNAADRPAADELVVAAVSTETGQATESAMATAQVGVETYSDVALAKVALDAAASAGTSSIETQPVAVNTAEDKEKSVDAVIRMTANAPEDDTLYVQKVNVNLREGPSTDHPIVMQLDKGQELMEFKRDGKWIHVGAYGTAGKIGWVHESLVAKDQQ